MCHYHHRPHNSYLQQNSPTVNAHGKHCYKCNNCNGDSHQRIHYVIASETDKNLWEIKLLKNKRKGSAENYLNQPCILFTFWLLGNKALLSFSRISSFNKHNQMVLKLSFILITLFQTDKNFTNFSVIIFLHLCHAAVARLSCDDQLCFMYFITRKYEVTPDKQTYQHVGEVLKSRKCKF